jgi:hypothetical protein
MSSIADIYDDLARQNPTWRVVFGEPDGPGWIRGAQLRSAADGPFNALLMRIGERMHTDDRRTIAASFALRYGWSAGFAIAPCVTHGAVPDLSLDNISIKFRESTFFECLALHEPRAALGAVGAGGAVGAVGAPQGLARLRQMLHDQTLDVVRALHAWSGFSMRGAWGQVTGSWASQFISAFDGLGDQRQAMPVLDEFFAGDDDVARMRPRCHLVTHDAVTHVYQRRASCCRYYLLPQGSLCASCPLVSHDERLRRNREFMQQQLARRTESTKSTKSTERTHEKH